LCSGKWIYIHHLFCVDTVQYSKILITTCNIPEVDGDVVGGSSVGQYVVGGGHVQSIDVTVVPGSHVTAEGWVLSSVLYVLSSVGLVVPVMNVVSSVDLVYLK